MLTTTQLRALERGLRTRKVLSIFIDTSAPDLHRRQNWRTEAYRALARLDGALLHSPPGERTARELCVAHLSTLLETIRDTPRAPGWVAYVTTDDVVAHGPVRERIDTRVFWRAGAVIAPLLPALTEPPVVAVAIANRSAARVYQWQGDILSKSADFDAEMGGRGAMVRRVSQHASSIAGREGCVVVGGTPEYACLLMRDLERRTLSETVRAPVLTMWSSTADIVRAAEDGARMIRTRRDRALLDEIATERGGAAADVVAADAAATAADLGEPPHNSLGLPGRIRRYFIARGHEAPTASTPPA